MRVQKLSIRDVLGVTECEFEAGRFNAITGPNGAGKTSVLEAIKALCKGGEDATLLRQGAANGEIVLVLDDGTELRRRITPEGHTTTVTSAAGDKVAKPGAAIRALVDLASANPVDFLTAKPKDRVDALLEALNLSVDDARLTEIVGRPIKTAPGVPAIDAIDGLHKAIFDDRTGTNRVIRAKNESIGQLEQTLPRDGAEAPQDVSALESTLADLDADKDREMVRIDAKLAGLKEDSDGRVTQVEADIQSLREQIVRAQEVISREREAFAEIQGHANEARQCAIVDHAAARAPFAEKIAAARANADAISRTAHTLEMITGHKAELRTLEADAEQQTARLDALTAYKSELLSALPVDGLAVNGSVITRHGVVFDRLNTAQRVEIAVEIAKLRAGPLKIMCVDGMEALDTAHYEAFKEQCIASGLQLFATRVSDGEFAVQTQA